MFTQQFAKTIILQYNVLDFKKITVVPEYIRQILVNLCSYKHASSEKNKKEFKTSNKQKK